MEKYINKLLSQFKPLPNESKDEKLEKSENKTKENKTKENDTYKRLMFVLNNLKKIGVRANYDPLAKGTNRVLLYTQNVKSKNYELTKNCNGLILDYSGKKSWDVICRPTDVSLGFTTDIEKKYDTLQVYKIRDGTIINLYWFDGRWRISTMRGLDMWDVSWYGVTYGTAFMELANRYGLDITALDKSRTYTFGFSSAKTHIYRGVNELWFISECEYEKPSTRSFVPVTVKIAEDTKEQLAIQTVEEKLSYKTIMQNIVDEKYDGFGYILRGPTETYLLESRLMASIRSNLYDNQIVIPVSDRIRYLATYAWLSNNKDFDKLFPKFKDVGEKCEQIFNTIVPKIKNKTGTLTDEYYALYAKLDSELDALRSRAGMTIPEIETFVKSTDYVLLWYSVVVPHEQKD